MKEHKSAVMQMFYGENGNFESVKSDPNINVYIAEIERNFDLLCEKLKPNAALLELFLKYNTSIEKLNCLENGKHYAEGFKFGLLIGVEAGESKFDG